MVFQMSACAMDPPSILARSTGLVRNAWHHGGPTAPFIHLVSAFCFVLPRIFIEAKLLEVGFLSRGKSKQNILLYYLENIRPLTFSCFFTLTPIIIWRIWGNRQIVHLFDYYNADNLFEGLILQPYTRMITMSQAFLHLMQVCLKLLVAGHYRFDEF